MKTIEKSRRTKTTSYVCGICQKESCTEQDIVNCEKSHSCDHKSVVYEWLGSEAWQFDALRISATCADCHKPLGDYDLEDIEDDQELMRKIYCLIKEWYKKEMS